MEAFKPGTEPTFGALTSTIRVGSGTDSLGGFFGGGALTPQEVPLSGEGSQDAETNEGVDSDLSDILDRAERAVNNELPLEESGGTQPELPVLTQTPTEEEADKPVEKALDDGLY